MNKRHLMATRYLRSLQKKVGGLWYGMGVKWKKAREGPLFLICGVFLLLWWGRLVGVYFVC